MAHSGISNRTPPPTVYADCVRRCVGCRESFVWTAIEQRDAALRDWWPRKPGTRRPPTRCPRCRAVMKRLNGQR